MLNDTFLYLDDILTIGNPEFKKKYQSLRVMVQHSWRASKESQSLGLSSMYE